MMGRLANSIPLRRMNAALRNSPFTLASLFISTRLFIAPELQFPLNRRPCGDKSRQQSRHVRIFHPCFSASFSGFSAADPHLHQLIKYCAGAAITPAEEEETPRFINGLLRCGRRPPRLSCVLPFGKRGRGWWRKTAALELGPV